MEMRNQRQFRASNVQFATREADGEKRIEGYFSVFDSDYTLFDGCTESVDAHAFDGELNGDVRCLIDHDTRLVLGRTTAGTLTLRTDEHGLFGSVLINQDDTDAMNLSARVQRGDVNQCSFGFDILDEEVEQRGSETHFTIKKVKLYEVSCVTFPAYESTSIAARKADIENSRKRQTEIWKNAMKERMQKWHSNN